MVNFLRFKFFRTSCYHNEQQKNPIKSNSRNENVPDVIKEATLPANQIFRKKRGKGLVVLVCIAISLLSSVTTIDI